MAKRRGRVKLSKAQKFDNDRNRWLAKKDAAISLLCKAMENLKRLDRQGRRLQKAALKPPPASKPKPTPEPAMDDPNHPDLVAARELLQGVNGKPRPKRQRKPKAEPAPDFEAIASAMADEGAARISREARMTAAGFRKIKK